MLAVVLDPQFKQLKFLVDSELQLVMSELTERMETIQLSSCEVEAVEPPAKKRKAALDLLLGEEETPTLSRTAEELKQYMAEKLAPRKSSPLSWWKENAQSIHGSPKLLNKFLAFQPLLLHQGGFSPLLDLPSWSCTAVLNPVTLTLSFFLTI